MIVSSLVSRSSTSLLQYLTNVKRDPDAVLFFSVTSNAYNLEAIISRLRSSARHVIGCLSAPLPGSGAVVCSTALFSSRYCVPFRSEIPGRTPIQVGRWNRRIGSASPNGVPDFTTNPLNWKDLATSTEHPQLPVELCDGRDINTLLFLSDNAPEGLSQSLSRIPHTNKLGLIASSTPFITGRPFTLFYDDQVFSSGAVGVGLTRPFGLTATVNFHGLVPLSAPVKVSKSEGNLLHALNHSNPSQMLIEALSTGPRMDQKDEHFFMGHLYPGPSDGLKAPRVKRVYRILSGGPSRGSIALESDDAPSEGETVQFFYQTSNSPSAALEFLKSDTSHGPTFQFVCSEDSDAGGDDDTSGEEAVQVFPSVFLAASENGFMCTETGKSKPLWKCTIPGGVGSLSHISKSATTM